MASSQSDARDGRESLAATPPHAPRPAFPVVGLGASAGGLQALQTFFDHMQPDSGMAFVVILHLAVEHESKAAALLQLHTAMPVAQVVQSVPLLANHVYVIPPARQLESVDGELRLREPESEQSRRVPIDHFFRSLAAAHEDRAIAVILSGTGSDGVLGIKRIKEWGGTIFVQDPQEAQFDAMPRSAIATGLADFVLPVAAIPERLVDFWHIAPRVELLAAESTEPEDADEALRTILAVLKKRSGHDFSSYKRPTLLRRTARRMQVVGVDDLSSYLEILHSRPEEADALLQDLLISVTNFFRDQDAWTALEVIIPLLFTNKGPRDQVRVWVTACSTGEEAYSVAMLLDEHAGTLDQPPQIQVFATDIDERAIRQACYARYPETIVADVSPERLRRYFVFEQGGYRVTEELRQMVLFAHHNVLRDPPFSRLDLVTCRNLLIYLNHDAQAQVIRLFHFSLNPGGHLLLGSAESLDGTPDLFYPVAKAQRLFQQRPLHPITQPLLLQPGPASPAPPRPVRPAHVELQDSLGALHQRLLLAHLPPSAIVTGEYDIEHLSRGAARFLRLEGEPSMNLLRAAHPDLRVELRTLLFQATQQGGRAERRKVRVAFDDGMHLVDLVVEPVEDSDWPAGYLLVLFIDSGPAGADGPPAPPVPAAVVRELEVEVQRLREQLQLTVEEYETAGEEYKAANEELQAINEEARAASEELETSKEELQAVNEELSTINQELKHRVEEISQSNNDLQNLIAATQIGTLFLDRELRLAFYTPSVEAIFNLIPADLNRPLAHVTHTLAYGDLAADAGQVLASLVPITREVESKSGKWYLVQLGPYRTSDDRIAGVVVTFVDITARRQADATLAERARLLDLSNDAIIVRNVDGHIIYWNQGATKLYGWTHEEALGQDLYSLLHTEFEAPLAELIQLLQEQDRLEGEVVQVTRDGRRLTLASRWALARDGEGHADTILTTYNDITERKHAEEMLVNSYAAERAARAEAEAALRTREQFLSIASHELRTPLTPLLGYTEILRQHMGQQPAQAQRKLLDGIERQGKRLNTLIGMLLDVSRLQRGQFTLDLQPLDLHALAARVVDDFRLSLGGDAYTITLLPPDAAVPLVGDESRLEEVLLNLLSNAVKYSPEGSEVRVRVGKEDGVAVLEVADSGIGIPAEVQSRLSEPFYRAPNIGTQVSGFGLGLYIVGEITQRHGGRVEIISAEGQGSTFRLILPVGKNSS